MPGSSLGRANAGFDVLLLSPFSFLFALGRVMKTTANSIRNGIH
jgi:hypothetical protein